MSLEKSSTSKKIRVLFMGTPSFGIPCLESLQKDPRYELVGVVSQPDRPAGRKMKLQPTATKQWALGNDVLCLQPTKASHPEFVERLKTLTPDIVLVVAYGQILRLNFLEAFPQKVINLHGSLLPRWRGAAPIQRAIMAGDTETGVCLQVMVLKLDAGDVIGELQVDIVETESALELHDRLSLLGSKLVLSDLEKYHLGKVTPVPQEESKVTIASKILKSESQLTWGMRAQDFFNKWRGMQLGPGVYVQTEKGRLKIKRIKKLQLLGSKPKGFRPGMLLVNEPAAKVLSERNPDDIVVCCQDHALVIATVQPESKKAIPAAAWLRGEEAYINQGEIKLV